MTRIRRPSASSYSSRLLRIGGDHVPSPRDLEVEFDIEVAGVGEDGAVLHDVEVLFAQDVLVACDSHEDVCHAGGVVSRHHLMSVHRRSQCPDRIDLDNYHLRPMPGRSQGDAAAAVSVSDYRHGRPSHEHVGGPDDPVHGGLAGAVVIVKEVLGRRVVDRYDRKPQGAVGGHGSQSDDPGRGFFGGSDRIQVGSFGVQEGGEVGAIVHGDVGFHVEDGWMCR